MKIGIIGAGKVGGAFCLGLTAAGFQVCGLTAASVATAQAAAVKFKKPVFATNRELVAASGVLLLTVPDRLIAGVAQKVADSAGGTLAGKIFYHCSGSLGLEVLAPLAELGAQIGSLHPLQSFADSTASLRDIYLAIDGSPAAQAWGEKAAMQLGAHAFHVPAAERKAYHAAACFASNYVVTALAVAQGLMSKWTPSPQAAMAALLPLFAGTVQNLLQVQEAREALTGPIARGDVGTVAAHLAVLPAAELALYRALGQATVRLAVANGTINESQAALLEEVLNKNAKGA